MNVMRKEARGVSTDTIIQLVYGPRKEYGKTPKVVQIKKK
jgi:hypothetical protein